MNPAVQPDTRDTTAANNAEVASTAAAKAWPTAAAMRVALEMLGVLDTRPEPIFDALAGLAALETEGGKRCGRILGGVAESFDHGSVLRLGKA